MKKAFDQTVRDLKREVNKKVLKVPSVEQKVLDATSNETWGPHGTLLADIAQASRNYQEYQMIMAVIWKRINDTGKNWRHVYKALTVLEYLVAHGSERVIDEIREHSYQIQTLSDFQYNDSSGRDQGSNVRKKSQSLVVLVNDKDRIQEVRQKAAANRDKFRNTSMSGAYRPGSYSSSGGYGDRYEDDHYDGRYGSRDEDRNGYGRERDGAYRDDDKYGRYGDPYGRDGDRYAREYEEYNSRDDEYRGRSPSVDDYQYGSRSRSSDRDRDRAYENDGQYSSRGSGARADDQPQDGSFAGTRVDQKYSEQNVGAPPSYEEAIGAARSPTHSERDGETSSATAPKPSSPPSATAPKPSSPPASVSPTQVTSATVPPPAFATSPAPAVGNSEVDGFDEFDPRGSFSAGPTTSSGAATTSGGAEMDLLGSLSEPFTANSLALVPTASVATSEADPSTNAASGPTYAATTSASSVPNQAFDDPFGDGPFKAIPSTDGVPGQQQSFTAIPSFQASNQGLELPQQVFHNAETIGSSVETFHGATYTPFGASNAPVPSTNTQYSQQELSTSDQSIDILADILPPTGPQHLVNSQAGFPAAINQPVPQTDFLPQTGQDVSPTAFQSQSGANVHQTGVSAQPGQPASLTGFPAQSGQLMVQTSFPAQSGQPVSQSGFPAQSGQPVLQSGFPAQNGQPVLESGFPAQSGQPVSQAGFPSQSGQSVSQGGFPAQSDQPSLQAGFPAQSGQPLSQAGFPAQSGQPVSQAGFPAHFLAQSGQPVSQAGFPAQSGQPVSPVSQAGFPAQSGQPPSLTGFPAQAAQASQTRFPSQIAQPASITGFPSQVGQAGFQTLPSGQSAQPNAVSYGNYNLQPGSAAPFGQMNPQVSTVSNVQHNGINFLSQSGSGVPVGSHIAPSAAQVGSIAPVSSQPGLPSSTGSLARATPPAKDKFETKSTVWADTLSRGLVNLNISGSKINPLSDIGIDFDALNRKEKRMEKPAAAPVTSTVTMGKAMGSGSGIGRVGAGTLRPSSNPMMSAGMGMGMGMGGPRPGIGMGGYGGMSQPGGVGMSMHMPSNMGMNMNMPPNMGMGMNMPPNMGMGMNMGMGGQMQQPTGMNMGMGGQMQQPTGMNMGMVGQMQQPTGMNMGMGGQMQQPTGFPPGSTMPGGYNPMLGTGNYNQQPYGGGYR